MSRWPSPRCLRRSTFSFGVAVAKVLVVGWVAVDGRKERRKEGRKEGLPISWILVSKKSLTSCKTMPGRGCPTACTCQPVWPATKPEFTKHPIRFGTVTMLQRPWLSRLARMFFVYSFHTLNSLFQYNVLYQWVVHISGSYTFTHPPTIIPNCNTTTLRTNYNYIRNS